MVGYEALARFEQEPRRTPDVWFAEAAAVGLATELELTAVSRALERRSMLPSDVFLTVNVSPTTAVSRELADLLEPPAGRQVILELTEHAAVADYDGLLTGLAPLRERGVRIAVDDAGAGFASLQHILRLQPDIIKLDISLVRDIDTEPVKRALASSLVVFATEIGATIVAEGIETEQERQVLARLGIGWGQGYLLGRPADLPGSRSVVDPPLSGAPEEALRLPMPGAQPLHGAVAGGTADGGGDQPSETREGSATGSPR